MSQTKIQCDKCGHHFSTKGGNYKKHTNKCDGSYTPFVKSKCCKHCGLEFTYDMTTSERANHTRWCDSNPKRYVYNKDLEYARSFITNESRLKQGEGVSKAHSEGKYDHVDHNTMGGRKHTVKTKRLMSEKALASPHRRLRRKMIEYKGVLLDSSWELELAKRLDELEIKWIRPDPISWVDEDGVIHNYFPDFYLEDYDLFLDPKNPYAIKVQKKKLDCLLVQYPNIIIIDSLEKCREYKL